MNRVTPLLLVLIILPIFTVPITTIAQTSDQGYFLAYLDFGSSMYQNILDAYYDSSQKVIYALVSMDSAVYLVKIDNIGGAVTGVLIPADMYSTNYIYYPYGKVIVTPSSVAVVVHYCSYYNCASEMYVFDKDFHYLWGMPGVLDAAYNPVEAAYYMAVEDESTHKLELVKESIGQGIEEGVNASVQAVTVVQGNLGTYIVGAYFNRTSYDVEFLFFDTNLNLKKAFTTNRLGLVTQSPIRLTGAGLGNEYLLALSGAGFLITVKFDGNTLSGNITSIFPGTYYSCIPAIIEDSSHVLTVMQNDYYITQDNKFVIVPGILLVTLNLNAGNLADTFESVKLINTGRQVIYAGLQQTPDGIMIYGGEGSEIPLPSGTTNYYSAPSTIPQEPKRTPVLSVFDYPTQEPTIQLPTTIPGVENYASSSPGISPSTSNIIVKTEPFILYGNSTGTFSDISGITEARVAPTVIYGANKEPLTINTLNYVISSTTVPKLYTNRELPLATLYPAIKLFGDPTGTLAAQTTSSTSGSSSGTTGGSAGTTGGSSGNFEQQQGLGGESSSLINKETLALTSFISLASMAVGAVVATLISRKA